MAQSYLETLEQIDYSIALYMAALENIYRAWGAVNTVNGWEFPDGSIIHRYN